MLKNFLGKLGYTPNRHPIIRFFISSTFVDMVEERNLLHSIIKDLTEEYAMRGWTIESIDLRWGISTKEGLDNHTMTICLDELDHCQKISPRPNFIMLLGERFGWIPLPETIPQHIGDNLSLNDNEKKIFNEWYHLDNNFISESQYILQGRSGRYVDKDVFENEVVKHLSEAFRSNAILDKIVFGKSATEQEIDKGVRDIKDAEDHVITYYRTLSDVPDDKVIRNIYFDESNEYQEHQKILVEKVLNRFAGGYLIKNDISFEDYKANIWKKSFQEQFTKALKQVIETEINKFDFTSNDYETVEHLTYSYNTAKYAIGREYEVKVLDDYINSSKLNDIFWISGEEGVGKTTLLALVASNYLQNPRLHTVVRFCGLTNSSSNLKLLENSLYDEIHSCLINEVCNDQDIWEILSYKCKSAFNRKVLIILDNVDLFGMELYSKLMSYPNTILSLDPNVRMIFSAAHCPKQNENNRIKLFGLQPSLLGYIKARLSVLGRRLSSSQEVAVLSHRFRNDQPTLYADLLCSWLSSFTSYQILPPIPEDLDALVYTLLSKAIVDDEQKGYGVLRSVISLLCIEQDGLSETEIIGLLAADEKDYNSIMNDNVHRIDEEKNRFEREIPTIVWLRIRNRIDSLIHLTYKGGRFFYEFRTKSILRIVSDYCLDSQNFSSGIKRLYEYHKNFSQNDAYPHSIRNLQINGIRYIKSLWRMLGTNNRYYLIRDQIIAQCFLNQEHLFKKLLLDKANQLTSFELLIDYLQLEKGEQSDRYISQLIEIKTSLNLLRSTSIEAISLEVFNLPESNSLRKICSPNKCVLMNNELHNINFWENSIIWTANNSCIYSGRISKDGKSIVVTKEIDSQIYVSSVHLDRHDLFIGSYRTPIIVASDDLNDIVAYDHGTNEEIIFFRGKKRGVLSSKTNIRRVDISADGHIVAIFSDDNINVYKDWKSIVKFNSNCYTYSGCLSRDGRFVWYLSDGVLTRYNIITNKLKSWIYTPSNGDNIFTQEKGNVRVVAASEHICLIAYMLGFNAASAYGGKVIVLSNDIKVRSFNISLEFREGMVDYPFYISEDEKTLLIHNRGQQVEIYSINEDATICSLVNSVPIPSLIDITRDFRYALTRQGQIIDMSRFLQSMYYIDGVNEGLNSISAPIDGSIIIASIGKEVNTEYYQQYIRVAIEKGVWELQKITPQFDNAFQYVSKSAISPDGSTIVLSSRSSINQLIAIDRIGNNIWKSQPLPYQCTGLEFSCNGDYILAGTGTYYNSSDYLENDTPYVYVFNRNGDIVFSTSLDGGNVGNISDQIYFSPNNRYAIWKGSLIIDIIESHIYNAEDALYSIGVEFHWGGINHRIGTLPPYIKICSIVSPDSSILLYNCTNHMSGNDLRKRIIAYDLKNHNRDYIETDLLVVSISPSGKHILFIDKNCNLLIAECYNNEMKMLATSVKWACFTNDGNNIFVQHINGILSLISIIGEVLKESHIGSSYNMKNCDKGLYGSNKTGRFFLFDVKSELGINNNAWCTLTYHWNLETRTIESTPYAICPHCGSRVIKDNDFICKIKNISKQYLDKKDCWNDPVLHGHHCPNCYGQLSFTPFLG